MSWRVAKLPAGHPLGSTCGSAFGPACSPAQAVRPQHFLPVHGEYAFLTEHALLAREKAGVNFVDVSGARGAMHAASLHPGVLECEASPPLMMP